MVWQNARTLLSFCYWPRGLDDFAVDQGLSCHCAIGQECERILLLSNVFVVSVLLANSMRWFCHWPRSLCNCAISQEYEMILPSAKVFVVIVLLAKSIQWFCHRPRSLCNSAIGQEYEMILQLANVFVVIVLLAKSIQWFCHRPRSLLSVCYWPRVWDDFAVGECLCCHCAIGQDYVMILQLAKVFLMRWHAIWKVFVVVS